MKGWPLFLGFALILPGCASDEENIQAWMEAQASEMRSRPVVPLPEIKPLPAVEYTSAEYVDPFQPGRIEPTRKGKKDNEPDRTRAPEPLEAYPLESLKMVGALIKGTSSHALILADKSLHRVKAGNHMGQNFGVITSISESEVTLRELVENEDGDWVDRISTLLLQEQQGSRK